MVLVFSCTNCGRKYEKDEALAGKKARCKDCGHIFVIPTPSRKPFALPVPARASPGPSHRPAPMLADAVDDPYGFNDLPIAKPEPEPEFANPVGADDELALPEQFAPSSPKRKKKRTSGWNEGGGLFDGLPGIVYLIIAVALGFGFLLTLVTPATGTVVFLGTGVLSFLVLFLYGFAGIVVLPFQDGVLKGILCWLCLPYLLGYVFREWERMRGCFLSYLASFAVVILMAMAMPGLNAMRLDRLKPEGHVDANAASFANPPPRGLAPSAEIDRPKLSNSITVVVSGLSHREAGKAFGDKLKELVGRVSGGFQISGSGGPGRSTYSIAMHKAVDIPTFAREITWAKVLRISGQTIEVDASGL